MNMTTLSRPFAPSLLFALVACANAPAPGDDIDGDPLTTAIATTAEPLSQAALTIEQAERMLDRGEAAAEAKTMLLAVLAEPQITADEKSAATLALSRAHEALGEVELAIQVIEREMATHAEDPSWSSKEYREHLLELLTGSPERQGIEPRKKVAAVPFARFLTKYFPANDDGRVDTRIFMIGGDDEVSGELGTFDVSSGIRAEREAACPLCTDRTNVHTSRSQSDWLMIPVAESSFGEALLVVYFDLGKNRIPARYERHLPMTVASIEHELEDGKSFILAKERVGAPPVVLIAAPRTAMLEDVERHLAELDRLPTELERVDVGLRLRPSEIQGVVRDSYFSVARACYDQLLEEDKQAAGKVNLRFSIQPEGKVAEIEIDAVEGNLDRAPFKTCMADAMNDEVRFPASGQSVNVTYPITFSPD